MDDIANMKSGTILDGPHAGEHCELFDASDEAVLSLINPRTGERENYKVEISGRGYFWRHQAEKLYGEAP